MSHLLSLITMTFHDLILSHLCDNIVNDLNWMQGGITTLLKLRHGAAKKDNSLTSVESRSKIQGHKNIMRILEMNRTRRKEVSRT